MPPVRPHPATNQEPRLRYKVTLTPDPVAAPARFNPDPPIPPIRISPVVRTEFGLPPTSAGGKGDANLGQPRAGIRRVQLVPEDAAPQAEVDSGTLPDGLELPRQHPRANQLISYEFPPPVYPLPAQQQRLPDHTVARTNRWLIDFAQWQRYTTGQAETPYQTPGPLLWHPYKQSVLKGDAPIFGQDIFLNLTASVQSEVEARRLPAGGTDFLGTTEQFFTQNYFGFSADLFRGETVWRPARWTVRARPVFNLNHLESHETGFLGGRSEVRATRQSTRTGTFLALQEAFGEMTLAELSDNYDFLALRAGNQPFNSDFRGFLFNDINTGLRLFGNAANNQLQYNLAFFDLREKETGSELNSFDERGLRVIAANVYRQDFLQPGYTAQISFHGSFDEGGVHADQNDRPMRPAPIGAPREHAINAFYLGWSGDGHLGRLNLTHAFYQVFGRDDFNGLAGRAIDLNAQMAALEVSLDDDWLRYKASFFYASGDSDPTDGRGQGFDAILDSPNFAGAPFSFYARQGFGLGSTGVGLKGRNSLMPTLRASKLEGQASFVNPGIFIYGLGAEARLTPRLRSFANVNYLRFANTASLEMATGTRGIDRELGLDLSLGFLYRPLLKDNVIVTAGIGALFPGRGFRDLYPPPQRDGDFLYSGLVSLILTY